VTLTRWRFDLYFQDSAGRAHPFSDLSNVTPLPVSGPGDWFDTWQHLWLPLAAWRSGAAVLHCHGNTAPRFSRTPVVTTLHDLTHLAYPPPDPNLHKWVSNVRRAARSSRRVLTPSEDARADIVARFGVPLGKIEVVRWGPTGDVTRTDDPKRVRAVRQEYGLTGPYLLHFGQAMPRKNTGRVIEAWDRLTAAERGAARLLVVGVESPTGVDAFRARTIAAGVADSCAIGGYVPEADVAPLLTAAAGLVP